MVPETLEPSLKLASAVLSELKMPQEEVAQAIQTFRKTHISDLQVGPALTGRDHPDPLPPEHSKLSCACWEQMLSGTKVPASRVWGTTYAFPCVCV